MRSGTGCPSTGFSFKQIWEGKLSYIFDFAPDTSVFSGMQRIDTITGMDLDTTGWFMGDKIIKANPTFAYFLNELRKGEDVEFGWRGGGFDHEMTLTSIHLTDANNNGTLDAGETASIDYIDPADPSRTMTGTNLTIDRDGFLTFKYSDALLTVQIYSAYSESPVPEPATVTLLVLGGLLLAAYRWRRAPYRRPYALRHALRQERAWPDD